MAKLQQPWYVEQRARSLAYVFLTNEPGIAVVEERGPDVGVDYRLVLGPGADAGDEWVGVRVKATERDPRGAVHLASNGHPRRDSKCPGAPVFLLVVNARDEKCWFAWIREPLPGRLPRLRSHGGGGELPVLPIDGEGYHARLEACRRYFEHRRALAGQSST